MVSVSQNTVSFAVPHPVITHEIGVFDLFRDHVRAFAGLPGEVSNFEQRGLGYQWHCEFELRGTKPDVSGVQAPLRLHFILNDMGRHSRPVAALSLVEGFSGEGLQSRFVHLQDLGQALDDINEDLAQRNEIIETSMKANQFIEALAEIREELRDEVIWE